MNTDLLIQEADQALSIASQDQATKTLITTETNYNMYVISSSIDRLRSMESDLTIE